MTRTKTTGALRVLTAFAVLATLAAAIGLMPAGAAGRSIHVAPSGSDGNGGGSGDPLRTIGAAMRLVQPGDTIWVGAGVYDEQVDEWAAVRLAGSGRPDAWKSLRAEPGTRPVIMAEGHTGIQSWGQDYWHVEGFEIDGSRSQINAGAGISWGDEVHHFRIVDNWVHDFRGGGISGVKGDHLHIEGNRVWGNSNYAPNQTSGISLYQNVAFDDAPGFHNVITGNYVYDNENLVPNPSHGKITDGNCIIIDDFRHTQFNSRYPRYDEATLITNNVCFDNGGRGVHVYLADNVHVANNTLFRNTRSPHIAFGELTAARATNVSFVNNLVVSRGGVEPVNVSEASGITFRANTYLESPRSSPDGSERYFSIAEARLANPTLDWDSIDLTPRSGSPLAGLGVAEPNVSQDFAGRPRPASPTPGALEPTGGDPAPPQPPQPSPPQPPDDPDPGPPLPSPDPTPPQPSPPQPPAGDARIDGRVDTTSGAAPAVVADLFDANGDGSRAAYRGSVATGPGGGYSLPADAGCHVVVLIAPQGTTFDSGSSWVEEGVCVEAGRTGTGPTGTVADGSPGGGAATIGDEAVDDGGAPVADLVVDLFSANADGSRAAFLGDTVTDAAGRYGFDVDAGCYVVVFIAPSGASFDDGSGFDQRGVCVATGAAVTDIDTVVIRSSQ